MLYTKSPRGSRRQSRSSSSPFSFSREAKPKASRRSSQAYSPVIPKINLHDCKQIESYKKSQKIAVRQQRLKYVQDKLQIQKVSKEEQEMRIHGNDLYLNYNRNPFAIHTAKKEEKVAPRKAPKVKNKKKQDITIFQALRELNRRSEYETLMERVKLFKVPGQQEQNLAKIEQQKRRNNKLDKVRIVTEQKQAVHAPESLAKTTVSEALSELDKICSRKDENQWQTLFPSRDINIFKFIKHPESPQFLPANQRLNKFYFCHESSAGSPNISQQSLKLGISKKARLFLKGKYNELRHCQENISSGDLIIDIQQLSFHQIMLISTGRLQPSVLSQYLDEETLRLKKMGFEVNQKQRKISEGRQVIYSENCEHYQLNQCNVDGQQMEGILFKQQPMINDEKIEQNTNQIYTQKITELFVLKELLTKYDIKDQNVNISVQQKIQALLEQQNSRNDKKNQISKNVDHFSISNKKKEKKTRAERIVNASLIGNLKMKKSLDHRLKYSPQRPTTTKSPLPRRHFKSMMSQY